MAEKNTNLKSETVTTPAEQQDDLGAKRMQNIEKVIPTNEDMVNEFFDEVVEFKKVTVSDDEEPQTSNSFADFDMFIEAAPSESDDSEENAVEIYQTIETGEGDVLYSTGDVAKMFDVTTQTIRNQEHFFVDILSDERGANGQKLYTNDDINILKKIFYMANVQKYKRRDIRDQFIKNGISAKGGNLSLENSFDELPKSGNEVIQPSNNNVEVLQNKINEAFSLMQKNVIDSVNDGLKLFETNIAKTFITDLQNNTKQLDRSISQTKDEMISTIKEQAILIEEQKKEIVRLKSTLININHTALEIDKRVKEISTGGISSNDVKALKEDLSSMIKESTGPQNNTKQIYDEIAKQSKTIQNIEEAVSRFEDSGTKNRTINIKADMADTLNRNYQKIEKMLKNNANNQSKEFDDMIASITDALNKIKDTANSNSSIDETIIDDLKIKLSSAIDEIERLKKDKENLTNENKETKTLLEEKNAAISELQQKVQNIANNSPVNENEKAVLQKFAVAQKLIEKLTSENEALKKKETISSIIIKKQDEQIARLNSNTTTSISETNTTQTRKNDDVDLSYLLD